MNKVNQLQLLQQNLENILMQKQQIESQLTEFNSALQEVQSTKKAYKIIGKIMVAASAEELTKDLEQKKEVAEIHLKNINKQEEKLKTNLEEMQKEVVQELKKNE